MVSEGTAPLGNDDSQRWINSLLPVESIRSGTRTFPGRADYLLSTPDLQKASRARGAYSGPRYACRRAERNSVCSSARLRSTSLPVLGLTGAAAAHAIQLFFRSQGSGELPGLSRLQACTLAMQLLAPMSFGLCHLANAMARPRRSVVSSL